jgi:hypothetical protein
VNLTLLDIWRLWPALAAAALVTAVIWGAPRPASAGWDWDIQGGTEVSLDSNITSASRNEKSDVVTRLRAGLGGVYEAKNRTIKTRVNLLHDLFLKNPDFDNTAADIDLDYVQELSRHDRLRAANRFERAEEITDFAETLGASAGRYAYHRNRLKMEYERDIARQLRLGAYYANEDYQVSHAGLSDSREHGTGFALHWVRSSATVFSLAYQWSRRGYDPGGHITVHALLGGFRRYLTKQFSVEALAGVSRRGSDSGERFHPRAALAAAYEFEGDGSFRLEFANSAVSGQSDDALFDSWRVTASLARRVLRRLRAEIAGFYGQGEFEDLAISEEVARVTGSLWYDLTAEVRAYISCGFTDKQSNTPSREYDKSLVSVGLEFTF